MVHHRGVAVLYVHSCPDAVDGGAVDGGLPYLAEDQLRRLRLVGPDGAFHLNGLGDDVVGLAAVDLAYADDGVVDGGDEAAHYCLLLLSYLLEMALTCSSSWSKLKLLSGESLVPTLIITRPTRAETTGAA